MENKTIQSTSNSDQVQMNSSNIKSSDMFTVTLFVQIHECDIDNGAKKPEVITIYDSEAEDDEMDCPDDLDNNEHDQIMIEIITVYDSDDEDSVVM